MSHFTVLVPANDQEHLEKLLQPYHEYECTGILDEYVIFVPEDMIEADEKFAKYHLEHPESYPDMDTFMDSYYGARKNEHGVYGRMTNPHKKWDWWAVGGRWTGTLHLKPEAAGRGINGRPGLMTEANKDRLRADSALVSEVNWEAMKTLEAEIATENYRKWHAIKSMTEKEKKDPDVAMFLFHMDQDKVEDFEKLTEEEYVKKHGVTNALTFAFIDLEGGWNERGRMGWWGVVTPPEDPEYDYNKVYWDFLESLPGDQRVFVVDCHI